MCRSSQRILPLIFILNVFCTFGLGEVSFSQIVRDGTVGPAFGSVVEPMGPNYQIDSTLGRIEGANLFHSFSDFNVQTLADGTIESATFTNSLTVPVQNILSRVTGENPSTINGTLASTIENANLFFLNPSGVMFGPNATLDLKGSFHVSTADVIRYEKNGTILNFYADVSLDGTSGSALHMPSLEEFGFLGDPTAFGFSGDNPRGTTLDARVLFEQSTLLVGQQRDIRDEEGKHIRIDGGGKILSVIGRDAQVGNVLEDGVEFRGVEGQFGRTFPPGGRKFAPEEGEASLLSSIGGRVNVVSVGHGQAGEVFLNENLDFVGVLGSSQPLGGISFSGLSGIAEDNSGVVVAGGLNDPSSVMIRGGRLELSGAQISTEPVSAGTFTNSGPITLTVKDIFINEGGEISASTNRNTGLSFSSAGDVTINAENLTVTGSGSNISANTTTSDGSGGNITIQGLGGEGTFANKVSLISDGKVSQNVFDRSEVSIDAYSTFNGPAGTISISANEIELLRNPNLSSGSGAASTIRTNLAQEITFYNEAPDEPGGGSGDITIKAQNFILDGNSSIQSGARVESSQDAGDITLNVDRVTIKERARISSGTALLSATGNGGTITIQGLLNPVAAEVSIEGLNQPDGAPLSPAGIFSSTQSPGNAGNIVISAERLNMDGGVNGASISTSSGFEIETENIQCNCSTERTLGDAGTITINVNQLETSKASISSRSDDNNGVARFRIEDFNFINGEVVTSLIGFQEIPLFGGKAGSITIQGVAGAGMPVKKIVLNRTILNTIVDSDLGEGNLPTGLGFSGGLRKGPANITVTTEEIGLMNDTAILANTTGEAPAGDIVLNVDTITAENSIISSTSTLSTSNSTSEAGNIVIQGIASSSSIQQENRQPTPLANTIRLKNSTVSTNSMSTTGGDITLSADFLIQLNDSTVQSDIGVVTEGVDGGGNIDFDSQFIVLQGDTAISARSLGGGAGGTVSFGDADSLIITDFARNAQGFVDVSSQGGQSGTIVVGATTQSLNEEVPRPDVAIIDPQSFLPVRCASQQGGTFSSIVEDSLDALPPEPGDFYPSPLPVFDESLNGSLNQASSISIDLLRFGLSTMQDSLDLSSQIALGSPLQACSL